MPPPPVYAVNPQPGQEHTHTVIILHGRDSSSEEFAREFFECEATVTTTPTEHTTTECDNKEPAPSRTLVASLFPNCRWVFPGAPLLLSERFGLDLCQWFDMWSTENPEERVELQEPGLRSSVTALLRIVHHEAETVPRGRIALGGISQGSVTALAAFLADTAELAGFFGFCAWMPPLTVVAELMNSHGTGMATTVYRAPILLEHSTDDAVVPVQNGRKARDVLRRLGLAVEWHEYEDGGHWINEPRGVNDFVQFLRTVFDSRRSRRTTPKLATIC